MGGYSILLVDDEELALQGIEQGVNWEKLRIETICKADSMRTALEAVGKHHIDLMLCDIEMPGGSGLELIERVRREHPEIVCIFYTCHADFEYCHKAIRLGALDYVLKPIPYEELEGVLGKGLLEVQKGNRTRQLYDIWDGFCEPKQQESPVKKVKQIIMENLATELSREELAEQVYTSADHLAKLFKKETGISINEYITRKRIRLAQQLLASTDLNVVEISARAGFSYSSYFVKIFRNRVGMTPQQYRNAQNGTEAGNV